MEHKTQIRLFGIPVWERRLSEPEVRAADFVPSGTLSNPSTGLLNAFGFSTSTGIAVSEESALTLSAVWSAIRVLGETLAMLPLNDYIQESEKKRLVNKGSRLQTILHDEPNAMMSSFTYRETKSLHVNLTGNSYTIIHRDNYNQVGELELIEHPREVIVRKIDRQKYYYYRGKTFLDNEILHIHGMGWDGLTGKNPVQCARENLGTGLALQQYGNAFFKNGVRNSGVLEVPGKLDAKVRENIESSFANQYAGVANTGKVPVLEAGMKFNPVSLSNEDAQYLSSRKFSIDEVARIFRVPPHMIASLESSTNNNIEHQGIEFAIYTMLPHIIRWEQEMNRKLIPVTERGRRFIKFNFNGLLRGDAASRASLYKELFYTGAITPNEIRRLEEMNDIEHGDDTFIPVNMVPAKMAGQNIMKQTP